MSVPVLAALPSVSESRIKRITRIARITTHRPTAIDLSPRPPFLRGKGERMAFLKVVSRAVLMALGDWITP